MKNRQKSKKKKYYGCCIFKDKHILMSTSMQQIANMLGIHPRTIARHLAKDSKWSTDEWLIEKDVEPLTIIRGTALYSYK